MKTVFSNFGNSILSKSEMGGLKGGVNPTVNCSWTECWGSDCIEQSGACGSSDAAACTWYISSSNSGSSSISNVVCG